MAAVAPPHPKPLRKKLLKRAAPDRSQALRRAFQLTFFALNVWIGIEFYLFVRYYESGGRSLYVLSVPLIAARPIVNRCCADNDMKPCVLPSMRFWNGHAIM